MKPRVKTRSRGFTIIELMMALAVLAVGISGVVAMQKLTAMTNLHSKSVAIATQIARGWQDQLLVDGSVWRRKAGSAGQWTSTTTISSTTWLQSATTTPTWVRPLYNTTREFGAAFDALGNPVTDNNLAQAHFCVHLQLVPILGLTDAGAATIRATIRVLWPRADGEPMANYCNATGSPAPAIVGDDTANFHSIYQTLAIRVHP